MHVLVAPNGVRYWRFSYRFAGQQKTLDTRGPHQNLYLRPMVGLMLVVCG